MSANKKMKDAQGAAKSTAAGKAATEAEEERYIVEEDDEFEEFETERESSFLSLVVPSKMAQTHALPACHCCLGQIRHPEMDRACLPA